MSAADGGPGSSGAVRLGPEGPAGASVAIGEDPDSASFAVTLTSGALGAAACAATGVCTTLDWMSWTNRPLRPRRPSSAR
jgi:hypothetical protein